MDTDGIKHITSAPYSTNTEARYKMHSRRKCARENRMSRFLNFDYRITPDATTGVAPCKLLMNRSHFKLHNVPNDEDESGNKLSTTEKTA